MGSSRFGALTRSVSFATIAICVFLVSATPSFAIVDRDLEAAQRALARGDAATALDALGDAPDEAPESERDPNERQRVAAGETLRGRALTELERWSEARAAYERALDWSPDERAAAEGLFLVLVEQEDWSGLLEIIGRWALREDSRPEILLLAGEAANRTGDALLALRMAELGVARFPSDLRFQVRRARALADAGSDALAERAWTDIAAREPGNATWWQALARIRMQRGDGARAREALAIAHALQPNDGAITRAYLASLVDAGHAPDALRLARTWMEAEGREIADIALVVRAAWIANEFELARGWLERVDSGARDADWFRWSLEIALVGDDTAAARTAADALIARGAADARIRSQAARLAELEGDLAGAEAHLRASLDDDDANASHLARLHLVRLLLRDERVDEAETFARAALDDRPTDVTAARLLEAVRREQLDGARSGGRREP